MNLMYLWASLATLCVTSVTSMGGVGGAFILVPIFYWLGLPMYEAATLGLLMAFFNMGTACISYHLGGNIKYRVSAALIVGILLFSPLASYVSAIANEKIVLLVFFVLLLLGGSLTFFYHPKHRTPDKGINDSRKNYGFGFIAGAAIGFISGLLGIGGGILVGPFLIWRGFSGKDISGTSSLVVVSSALVGFLSHLRFMGYAHVQIHYLLLGSVVLAAIAGGAIGSNLARFKLSSNLIRRIIGTFEYLMAARIIAGLAGVGAVLLIKHLF